MYVMHRILHSVLLIVNVGVVLLLLLTGYAYTLNPVSSPILSLLCYAFPLVALVNVVFFIYWLLRLKLWLLISLAGFLLTIGTSRIWFPVNAGTAEDEPGKTIKVMTFNVMYLDYVSDSDGNGMHPIVEYIAQSDADIVCLQEVGTDFLHTRLKDKKTKKLLKAYRYVLSGSSEGRYSVVCLSKYPVISRHRIDYESQSNSSYRYDFQIDDQVVTVINNHLESNKLNSKEKDHYTNLITSGGESEELTKVAELIGSKVGSATSIRAAQARAVSEEISACEHPVIVCGDFNDVPGSYVYKTIAKGLSDSWVEQGLGWGNTFHENMFLFRIDYILHSSELKTVDVMRDKVKISDHYPLIATLQL